MSGLFAASIGILGISLLYQIITERETEDNIKRIFLETLCLEDDNDIPNLYKVCDKKLKEKFLAKSLDTYCANKTLSSGFYSYVKGCTKTIKKDEEYTVTIIGKDKGVHIRQEVSNTRIFSTNNLDDIYLKTYFVFRAGEKVGDNAGRLDQIMHDHKYFFREELMDATLVNEIIAIYENSNLSLKERNKEILKKLKYTVTFEDDDSKQQVNNELMEIVLDEDAVEDDIRTSAKNYYGIEIRYKVPKSYIIESSDYYSNEHYVEYTAKLQFEYPMPASQHSFYVVYTIPTIGAKFNIFFKAHEFENYIQDHMTFISLSDSKDKEEKRNKRDGKLIKTLTNYSFVTSRIVFPRSGFVFYWQEKEK